MARYGVVIDIDRCTGCYNCFLSCKDEFVGNDYLPLSLSAADEGSNWVRIEELEHGQGDKVKVDYTPIYCQHCQDAPCIKPEFGDAVYRRADGIVIIDPVKAKGNQAIAKSCPYGAIQWNAEKNVAQKCTMCAHMIDAGEAKTRCSESCPTQAMIFGDLDDPKSDISLRIAEKQGKTEALMAELKTNPLVQYFSLPTPFIAGEVILADVPEACAEGVKLTLTAKADGAVRSTTTDFMGDFEFKWLTPGAKYVLRVEQAGYKAQEIDLTADMSRNLGEIVLAR